MNKEALIKRLDEARTVLGLAKSDIESYEAQLADAEKPELRHGDVWGDEVLGSIVILEKTTSIDNVQRGEHRQSDKDGVFPNSAESHSASPRHFMFNIFDDLKAQSKPLKWFGAGKRPWRVGCELNSMGHLEIKRVLDGEACFVDKCDISAFILNLQRLLRTELEASHE